MDATQYLDRLLPTGFMAMGAESVAKLIDGTNTRKVDDKMRAAITRSMTDEMTLSPAQKEDMVRFANRIAEQNQDTHIAWSSMPYVRGAIATTTWATAVETTLHASCDAFCTACVHEDLKFQRAWQHYQELVPPQSWRADLACAYESMLPILRLRNRLTHGKATPDDYALLKSKPIQEICLPFSEFRTALATETLRLAFQEEHPRSRFAEHGMRNLQLPESMMHLSDVD